MQTCFSLLLSVKHSYKPWKQHKRQLMKNCERWKEDKLIRDLRTGATNSNRVFYSSSSNKSRPSRLIFPKLTEGNTDRLIPPLGQTHIILTTSADAESHLPEGSISRCANIKWPVAVLFFPSVLEIPPERHWCGKQKTVRKSQQDANSRDTTGLFVPGDWNSPLLPKDIWESWARISTQNNVQQRSHFIFSNLSFLSHTVRHPKFNQGNPFLQHRRNRCPSSTR